MQCYLRRQSEYVMGSYSMTKMKLGIMEKLWAGVIVLLLFSESIGEQFNSSVFIGSTTRFETETQRILYVTTTTWW